jgi:phosphoribulokinase
LGYHPLSWTLNAWLSNRALMSKRYPIIAVTGSSGAGTTSVRKIFEELFQRERLLAAFVEGDSFHRYTRDEMRRRIEALERNGGRPISHFGPESNHLDLLQGLFEEYGQRGTGRARLYLHSAARAAEHGYAPGTFTPWAPIAPKTDLLFYEGLHGGLVTETIDVARHVDLLIGVAPTVNLEWIQKIHRDMQLRGYSVEAVTQTILRRMHDYVHYITPQFSRTHINFQRVPTVDTSNPFAVEGIPAPEESMVVIRLARREAADCARLLQFIDGAFNSRPDTVVVPGTSMAQAMDLILTPRIRAMMEARSATA